MAMRSTRRLAVMTLGLAIASAAWLGAPHSARAQAFPAKPVQLMVAFPAGGSTDVGARILAAIAEKELGQPLVVVNKGGAGGQVGWTDLARQKPDGYYLGMINLPAVHTTILDPERKAIFKEDAFVPLINQVLDPGVIWVKADSPYKTLADLVEAAKKNPNKVSTATTGILSDDHLAILMLEEAAPGAIFRIVHLEGSAQQITQILGGHIEVAFDNVGSIFKRVRSGEIRALAVLDTQRSRFLPEVPTTPELGYPNIISSSTRGIALPKGVPAPVAQRLEAVLKKAMESEEHVKKTRGVGPGAARDGGRGVREVLPRYVHPGQEVHRVGAQPPAPVIERTKVHPYFCPGEFPLNRWQSQSIQGQEKLRGGPQSTRTLASFTTRVHLAISARMKLPNCSGVPPTISATPWVMRSRISAGSSTFAMSALSLVTILRGVPAGAR
jgi:tripartite-type tricarboxylate transporter receptor subunit TctC